MKDYHAEKSAALEAARRASAALLDAYAKFQVIPDAPSNISTDADRLAQEIILGHLHECFPHDALCAEEATPLLQKVPQTGPRQWIVDPIDGTRGFARKTGEFSVMIAFLDQRQIVVGVVQEPAKQRLTFAVRGQGCWIQDDDAKHPERCRVTMVPALREATLVQSRSNPAKGPTWFVKLLEPQTVVETYSAGVKLARVARGEADLYVNDYRKFSDWDIAAGDILVTEAGGQVSGLAGEDLQYGLPGAAQSLGLLASNGILHNAALARIAV